MVIIMECYVLAVFLMTGIINGIQGERTQGALLFRSSTSVLQYIFPKTETSTEIIIRLVFSTSKCGGKILDIPSRDTQQHYYSFNLESSGKLFFEYNILDGKFELELNNTVTNSFCDGNKHFVYLRRLNRDVYYRVDSGNLHKHVEQEVIQKPSLSKPDGVFVGGDDSDKFAGCIYNASVIIHWSKLPESRIDLVKMYLDGDPEVNGRDLFIGACVDRSAECQSLRTNLHVTRPSGIIAGPAPKNNITSCIWFLTAPIQYRIKLTFLLLRVNNSLDCVDNHVEVMEGKNIESHMIGRYCNPRLTSSVLKPIYSVGRHLTVALNINSSKSFDFVAEYTSVSLREGPCPVRAELTGKTGTFSTPDFPYSHGNSKVCMWTIDVPRGMHVLITFKRNDFHIEGCSADCKCDYLEVSTESDGRQYWYGRYCGFIRPSPIYLTGKKVVVKFFSDSEESRRGFRAKFAIIDSIENPCFSYILLKNSTGVITSPRFPLPYPGQSDCLWAIKGPLHSRVKLTFMTPLYLDMNCTDYIEVTDAATRRAQTFMKKVCITSNVPRPIVSGTRDLFLRFVSDKYQQLSRLKTGFVVKYEVLHGFAMGKVSGVTSLTTNISLLFISILVFLLWLDIVHL